MPRPRSWTPLVVAALLAACQAGGPTRPPATGASSRPAPRGGASTPVRPTASGDGPATSLGPDAPAPGEVRPVGAGARELVLAGRVRLISDKGASVISNNGGGLVGNNGAGVISNNGGGILGKMKLRLAQAAPAEAALADARVEVLDAAGRQLVGADGAPIGAVTDGTGAYRLTAALPDENLVLRVRLGGDVAPGELKAFLVRPAAGGGATVDVDTASTLGAAYVLTEYVQGSQERLDRLPADAATALRIASEAASRRLPAGAPSYEPAAVVAAVQALRALDAALDATLVRIEALLLAGQSDLGDGQAATSVPLSGVSALARDAAGNVYLAEGNAGRIRQIRPDGTIRLFAGQGGGAAAAFFADLADLACGPDGALYAVDGRGGRVRKIAAGGGITDVGFEPGERPAFSLEHPAEPSAIAAFPDGRLAVGYDRDQAPGHLSLIGADGRIEDVAPPADRAKGASVRALALGPDGALHAAWGSGPTATVYRRGEGGAWARAFDMPSAGKLVAAPGGALHVSDPGRHAVSRVDAGGRLVAVAGTGTRGSGGDGGPALAAQLDAPEGLAFLADGTLLVGEAGSRLVRAVAPDGTIRTFAGARAAGEAAAGDALQQPTAVAVDAEGRVVFSEPERHAIRRLEGGRNVRIAGGTKGFAGDGGAATDAAFNRPGGLAYDAAGALWVADEGNHRIRRIGADGTIETMAGTAQSAPAPTGPVAAREAHLPAPRALAVGPGGVPYWADAREGRIFRLKDGQVEPVAGLPAGVASPSPGAPPDGPALEVPLGGISGLAFDAQGNLYLAETATHLLRRLTPAGRIETVAGQGGPGLFLAFMMGQGPSSAEGVPAREALVLAPTAVAVAPDGTVYYLEGGSKFFDAFAADGSMTSQVIAAIPRVRSRLRKIGADGKVVTVAGEGSALLAGETPDDSMHLPLGLAFDRQGRLVVADTGNDQLKVIPAEAL